MTTTDFRFIGIELELAGPDSLRGSAVLVQSQRRREKS